MNKIVIIVLSISSFFSAISIIINFVSNTSKTSKKGVDKYIQNQMAPSLKEIKDSIDNVHDEINNMKKESDEDKMQRLRYECLCFASDIRKGEAKTRQEYEEIFRMESEYDRLIDKYKIKNGYMEEEMLYVHNQYRSLNV